jgi:hypothetical protein
VDISRTTHRVKVIRKARDVNISAKQKKHKTQQQQQNEE